MNITKLGYSFITSPIFYLNGPPHIGHLYTVLLCDALHRYTKLKNPNCQHKFSTGTDEHGLKVAQAAATQQNAASNPQNVTKSYCDRMSHQFGNLMKSFNISCTDFTRTTDLRHHEAVSSFWKRLQEKDLIYRSNYEGWYSVTDETFVPTSQIEDKKLETGEVVKISSESGNTVQWTNEQNYMFKLSEFREEIIKWIQIENPIRPELFSPLVLKWLETPHDLSVSRPRSRVTWGISVPNDDSQVIYVWLDALVNYLTACGYPDGTFSNYWPPTTQILGKDILKFHSIYWPAFLLATDLKLPRKILCHSHWTVDNLKMSKSLGNVVDPFQLIQKYGIEAVRYFLLREGIPHSDGNFNESKMFNMVNAELADTLGNLLSRCSGKAINPNQIWPKHSSEEFSALSSSNAKLLVKAIEELPEKVEASFEDSNFYRGIENMMTVLRLANLFVEEEQPWKLVKSSPTHPELLATICLVFETLRVVGIMLQPIVPSLSSNLLDKLNVPNEQRFWSNIRPYCWNELNLESRPLDSRNVMLFARMKS